MKLFENIFFVVKMGAIITPKLDFKKSGRSVDLERIVSFVKIPLIH